ncbi:MAG: hypothetical protein ABI671_17610 [Burkholderiales bacterium]
MPSPPPALESRPAHLVPCGQCSALNGRSALVCWACEADLLAFSPFAAPPLPQPPEPEPEPVTALAVHQQTVVEQAGAADGRGGLRLVSRGGAPASVQPAPAQPAPVFSDELPVLTSLVEEPVPVLAPEPLPAEPKVRVRYPAPMVALVLAVVLLLLIAAGLRWWGAPAATPPPVAGSVVPIGEASERPFASPVQGNAPDDTRLSFPPREVAPTDMAADRPVHVPARAKPVAPARAGGKARVTRQAVAQAVDVLLPAEPAVREGDTSPAACTSNRAALGLCTLEPASSKE